MPILQLLSGQRPGTQWPVLGDRFVLGGLAGCDLIISDPADGEAGRQTASVSRRHAVISRAGGDWYIEDGDGRGKPSRNGTFVNDERLPVPGRRLLRDRDRIRICGARFSFRLDPESPVNVEASLSHADSRSATDAQPADRLRLLLDLSGALRGTLDPDAVLDRTLEHALALFPQAARGLVVFRDGPDGPLTVRAVRAAGGGPADGLFSSGVVRRCLDGVEAVLGNDLPAQFPDSESVGDLAALSLMCAPVWTPQGKAVGAVQLETRADCRRFTLDDLRLFLGVVNQASVALGTAHLHRDVLALQRRARDLEVAQQVQRALLPDAPPAVPGYEFFAHYEAAQEVGGDYYDFVPLPGRRLAVLLGDVSGKGVAAALVMARFGAEARACLEGEPDPPAAAGRLNSLVLRAGVPEKFVTLALAVLDPAAHTVEVVNAGHPSPLLVRAGGAVEEVAPPAAAGLPIGIADGPPYGSVQVRLGPGDCLLLFSDGVSEAMDGTERLFGTDGIRAAVRASAGSCRAVGEDLLREVRRHAAGCAQHDDITVVCFGRVADRSADL